MNLSRVLPFSATSLLLMSIGCGSSPSTATTTPTPSATPTIYVIQDNVTTTTYSILEFPANAQGSVAPTATINAPANTQFDSLAVDGQGYLYVYAFNNTINIGTGQYPTDEILVYAPGATGAATPVRTLTGQDIDGPFAVDAVGQIYTFNGDGINVYATGANGNATPIRVIYGNQTLVPPGNAIAVDSAENIYVADTYELFIPVFSASASGNVAPTRMISGAATQIVGTYSLAVDTVGDLFATSSGEVLEFAPGANGNATPTRTLSVISPYMTVDGAGNVYDISNLPGGPKIEVFTATQSGSVVPAQTITSTAWTTSYISSLFNQIAVH